MSSLAPVVEPEQHPAVQVGVRTGHLGKIPVVTDHDATLVALDVKRDKLIARGAKKEPAPGTLGLLCDPNHPLFAEFPTESHSNWQWWYLVMNSRAIILDATPTDYRPIVQVIDNFDRNHKLGTVFHQSSFSRETDGKEPYRLDGESIRRMLM